MSGAHPRAALVAHACACCAVWELAAGLLLGTHALACSAEASSQVIAPAELISDTNALRARVSACLGVDVLSAVSYFGPELVGGLPKAAIVCLEATSDCAGVLECFGWVRDSCTGMDECRGSAALHCAELANHIRVLSREDCAQSIEANHTCTVADDGKSVLATCNAGACRGDRCEGDVRVNCRAEVEVREDCALEGRICVSGSTGVFCALPEPCTRDECLGNTAVACRDGYVDVRQDCATLVAGGVCRDSGPAAECIAETWHPECPEGEPFVSFCAGSDARACYLGALYEAKCSAFVGGHCEVRERGIGARCRLPIWP